MRSADLFSGLGGTSTGAVEAGASEARIEKQLDDLISSDIDAWKESK